MNMTEVTRILRQLRVSGMAATLGRAIPGAFLARPRLHVR
jgi:hypothetical protein